MDDSGLLSNTIIICTADHGEHFGEHGMFTHSHYLYEQALHVPLIISGPEVPKNERRSDLVSLVDLFDTLCYLTRNPSPDITSGESMFREKKRDHVFAEYGIMYDEPSRHARYLKGNEFESFRAGRMSIINKEYRYEIASNGEERIFQRSTDTEVENPDPDRLRKLKQILERELGEDFGYAHKEVEHAKRARENLRKLGYID
ncbi:sulfatase-like hydrolase/transferase [Haloarcula argentinensis]|uniref:Sulfatase-like hydrolase/transferase n=1 Tax=Haloarcula argentinensis TaxID=43776 RepID=A0A847UEK7_HALAR|nr:sulfatase-like hydrolase/transferase [Haloarcula argentinensis]NLV11945.1 sulfatase-like hydrolase/transferase [Haloarcula argentinensis]